MTRPELSPVNTVSEPLWGTIGNLANEIARRSHHGNDERFAGSESERGDERRFNAFDTCLCLRKWVIRCCERRVRPPLLVQKFRKSDGSNGSNRRYNRAFDGRANPEMRPDMDDFSRRSKIAERIM